MRWFDMGETLSFVSDEDETTISLYFYLFYERLCIVYFILRLFSIFFHNAQISSNPANWAGLRPVIRIRRYPKSVVDLRTIDFQ